MRKPTGSVRYKNGILTVTVLRKHGKNWKPLVVQYTVEDANPDKRVANPAFTLTKEDGEVYHVHQNEFGIRCDCVDGELREKRGVQELCKHARALQAVDLLPKS